MRIGSALFAVVLALAWVAGAWAEGPVAGTYRSVDGELFDGHTSRAWIGGVGELFVGNSFNGQSWDGGSLGAQWSIGCPVIGAAPILIFGNVNAQGNGQEIWQLSYTGGTMALSGTSQAWSPGTPTNPIVEYEGPISSMTVIMTLQYVAFQVVGGVTNINLEGPIATGTPAAGGSPESYDDCYEMLISSEFDVGNTTAGSPPADYPGFVDGSCSPGPSAGSWWVMDGLTLTILGDCVVPTEETSWGAVKGKYR
jgi:hypothetical protein